MAGRGRGRGKSVVSITHEQLGVSKDAQIPQVVHPPPNFPPLINEAVPLTITSELSYLFELKRDFAESMKESPHYIQPVVVKKDIERYCDQYEDEVIDYDSGCDWSIIPAELKSAGRKRKVANDKKDMKKKKIELNIEEKLSELEKREFTQPSDAEEDLQEDEETDKDPDEVVEDEEEDVDEEMDDGTDYVNNYFDNGEAYDEEDDNMDDGPVY